MRGITVRVTLAILALVAALHLSTQRAGVAEAQTFDLEKAVTGAKTPADHEAVAAYYDKEVTTAQAKAEEHRKLEKAYQNLAGKGQFKMEEHCHQLAQHYESVAAANAALAEAHRQMAREAV
jgi:hypothetical protein